MIWKAGETRPQPMGSSPLGEGKRFQSMNRRDNSYCRLQQLHARKGPLMIKEETYLLPRLQWCKRQTTSPSPVRQSR